MEHQTPPFSLDVDAVSGTCPAGERYANEQIARRTIPILSCEGPCVRGEIARQAAHMVASEDALLARACHAEAFFVPHSAMRRWVSEAERVVMIDGCFLRCHGRVLRNLVPPERIVQFDAHAIHRRYSDAFSIDEVPEPDRIRTAREVANAIKAQWVA